MLKARMTATYGLYWTILVSTGLVLSSAFAQDTMVEKQAFPPMIPIYKDPPRYPKLAYEQDIEGWVHAQFVVLKDGTVDKNSIVVLDEEPADIFTRSAILSAESLRFNPRLSSDGLPLDAEGITYLFRFVLRPPSSADSYYSDAYTGRLPPTDP